MSQDIRFKYAHAFGNTLTKSQLMTRWQCNTTFLDTLLMHGGVKTLNKGCRTFSAYRPDGSVSMPDGNGKLIFLPNALKDMVIVDWDDCERYDALPDDVIFYEVEVCDFEARYPEIKQKPPVICSDADTLSEPDNEITPSDSQTTLATHNKPTLKTKTAKKSVFDQFENLRSSEVSLVIIGDNKIEITIGRKTLTISPQDLGLKLNSQGMKLLIQASMHSGNLEEALKTLNKTTDIPREKSKVKSAVSRLRSTLKKAMGLIDDPITQNTYQFMFKQLTHELLRPVSFNTKTDAMDFIGSSFDETEAYGENEHDDLDNYGNSYD